MARVDLDGYVPDPDEERLPPCGGNCPPEGCYADWCAADGPYDDDEPVAVGNVGTLFVDGPLEVVVWLDCPHDQLRDLAILLHPGADYPEPEPGRHLLALTVPPGDAGAPFVLERDATDDPKAFAYGDAYLRATGMAALAAFRAQDAGIPATVYAFRVQPVGAEFPTTYQHAARQDDLAAGERG